MPHWPDSSALQHPATFCCIGSRQADARILRLRADPSLTRLLATAHRWWGVLRQGELNIGTLAAKEGVTSSWMTRVLRLAFLSPNITEAILAGAALPTLDGLVLTKADAVPG